MILHKHGEIIRYVIFGAATTIVSLLSYYILVYLFFNPNNIYELQIVNIISWIIAVSFAYYTNKKYVFNSSAKVIGEITKFFYSRLFTLFIDMLTMHILVIIFFIDDKISKIIVQFIIVIMNYVFSKWMVFK